MEKRLREGLEYQKQCLERWFSSMRPTDQYMGVGTLIRGLIKDADKVLSLPKSDTEKQTEKYIEVAKAAEAIRDYLVGVAHPEAKVPPGNLERLDKALDDLEGVPKKDRVKPRDAKSFRESDLNENDDR